MADLDTPASIVGHGVGAVSSGGLGAWLMHLLRSRQESEERRERAKRDETISVTLAELVKDVREIRQDLSKYERYGERIAVMEQSIKSMHERIDSLTKRRK